MILRTIAHALLLSGASAQNALRSTDVAKAPAATDRHGVRELAPFVTYEGEITSASIFDAIPCEGCGTSSDSCCDYCESGGSSPSDPSGYRWWGLTLTAGTKYNIGVSRIDCEIDLVARLYFGADDFGTMTFVASADDNAGRPSSCFSCWGDPNIVYTPTVSGLYTLAVSSFLSCACPSDGDYEYGIYVDPPPVAR